MKLVSLKWKDESFFDGWSLVHCLWGVILGVALYFGNFSPMESLWLAIALMVAWEALEKAVGIGEYWPNVLSDILVGVLGFVIGFAYLTRFPDQLTLLFWSAVLFMIILEFLGWRAFIKRGHHKKFKFGRRS